MNIVSCGRALRSSALKPILGALVLGSLRLGAMEPAAATLPGSAPAASAAAWRDHAERCHALANELTEDALAYSQGVEGLDADLQVRARANARTYLSHALAASLTAAVAEAELQRAIEIEAAQSEQGRAQAFRHRMQRLEGILEARQTCLAGGLYEPRHARFLQGMAEEQRCLLNAQADLRQALALGITTEALALLESMEALVDTRIPVRPPTAYVVRACPQ